jgi:parvulin-like peptidyl-prolyl isomerase
MNLFCLTRRHLIPALVGACQFALLPVIHAGTNGLAATVNGRAITKAEVDDQIMNQIRSIDAQVPEAAKRAELKSKLRKESLESLIDRELMLAEYQKLSGGQPVKQQYVQEDIKDFVKQTYGGDNDKFLKELKQAGLSLKKFSERREKMLIVQMIRSHVTKEVGIPTPDKKTAFLKKHGDMFRGDDYIKLHSITISKFGGAAGTTPEDQKKLIKEIRARVLKGGDFASEAKTYSNDSHSSAGGAWNEGKWIDRKVMSARMATAAFALDAKSISDVIEDEENYYLFYVEAKQPGKMKPTSEIEPELEKLVQNEERTQMLKAWLERTRSKANIKQF